MPDVLRLVAVAAALTVAVCVPAVASAATATAATSTATNCNDLPIVYLVHGINQGPTVSNPQITQSPTLLSFRNDLESDTDIPGFKWWVIEYPAASGFNVVATWDTYMNDGERNLQSNITSWNKRTCSGDRHIALVGYSMGAWVIDKWLQDHKSEWGEVKAVTLYGDPCWHNSHFNYGLTRLFLDSYGCGPASTYPYPEAKAQVPFPIVSYSLNLDPVSGDGYQGSFSVANTAAQGQAALTCWTGLLCPHLDYQTGKIGSGDVYDGASLVAKQFQGLL